MTYKHVAISQQSFDHMEALAESWDMDNKELVENMIMYFRLTGDDPTATKKDNTAVSIKKLQNTVVSFFKIHETDHLKKIVTDFEETRKKLADSQTKQTKEIKESIDKASDLNDTRLSCWFYEGIGVDEKTYFSVNDQFKNLTNKDTEIIDLIKNMSAKNEKKKRVLFTRLETMEEEVKKWGTITKDGNKERAGAQLNELKNLVNVAY